MSNRVTVNVTDQRGAGSDGFGASRWFVAGLTERGPVDTKVVLKSIGDYTSKLGNRVTYGLLYDCADEFFKDGGKEMIVGRVVGPDAAVATHTFADSASNPALTVSANSPGEWGNGAAGGLKVQISTGGAGGTFVVTVKLNNVVKEISPDLADALAAITWAENNSSLIVVTDPGAVGDPAVAAATNLAGGADDRASIVTGNWTAALATMPASLGCGQVSAPGATTTAIQQAVIDHAATTNRVPILDSIPGGIVDDIVAQVTSLTGEVKRAILVAPWAVIPGLTTNTTRTIPYSAVQAALIAKSDATGGAVPAVDEAVAAANGASTYATDLEVEFTDDDLAALDAGQVIGARVSNGQVQTYGDRTLADPDTEPQWYQVQSARTVMYAADEGAKIGSRYVFATLDPALVTVGFLKGDLKAFLSSMSPGQISNDPASSVDASQDTTARTLTGSMVVQPNQSAEAVEIDITVEVS